ncbi:MAG: I78 family peptidase inhibitor [Polaromonas sp.]|uniref:I78 family peptidase inhibitor n=1 Tax=Polaromonas sp. TaxID=1869339 RepID=UPI0027303F94|nr:I78 family peptidase inhibitor [Polaromonas sp.]MDP1742533.1 I78 family peptidase inhibitor [Polaromonas sp.]MDP1952913.1 I78 family peptidase inhibitor [Polaromonas sp.]MDP3249783.1 I78 family peptidase inhibitor [Polaromonas sp.]MDP3752408.1 I78 family peptidase inhibitor [Polaromonas sp.]
MSLKLLAVSLAVAGLGVLTACTTPGSSPSTSTSPMPPPPAGSACNAQGAQFAIGKAPGASVVEEARQRSGSYIARVLRPGQMVTMEFNAQRLNLDLDAAGVIRKVRCG